MSIEAEVEAEVWTVELVGGKRLQGEMVGSSDVAVHLRRVRELDQYGQPSGPWLSNSRQVVGIPNSAISYFVQPLPEEDEA